MYQAIYIERTAEVPIVHLFDDVNGYLKFPYKKYAYRRSSHGHFRSLYGDKLEKVTRYGYDEPGLFESDVPIDTRVLTDLYLNSDEISTNHRLSIIDIEVSMEGQMPDVNKAENEITSIALFNTTDDKYFVFILNKNLQVIDSIDNNVEILSFNSESELLETFLSVWNSYTPTQVTGWNINGFDIPYLYNRLINVLSKEQANALSPIGIVSYNKIRGRYFIAGVSVLDYLMLYKKFSNAKEPNYRLDSIGRKEVGMGKTEYDGTLDILFKTDIKKFIEYNLNDIIIVKKINDKFKFIELTMSICHIGHVQYEDIEYSSRYLEGAMIVYLRRNGGLIAPNKSKEGKDLFEALQESGEQGFTGAFVKEPIPGKYDWVYDLDLTSMYPNIMISLNISPETKYAKVDNFDAISWANKIQNEFVVENKKYSREEFKQFLITNNLSLASNGVMYTLDKQGFIPTLLVNWFNKRKEYRKLAKEWVIL